MNMYDDIEKTAEYWRDLKCKYKITYVDCVVMFNSDEATFEVSFLNNISKLMKKKSYKRIVAVVYSDDQIERIKLYGKGDIVIELSDKEIIDNIAKLYSIHRFASNIYFTSLDGITDVDTKRVCINDVISVDDVVCTALLKLDKNHSSNIESQYEKIEYRHIDEEKYAREFQITDESLTHTDRLKLVIEGLEKRGAIEKSDKIVLFGETKTAERSLEFLTDYNVIGIIDNNINKIGMMIKDLHVYKVGELLQPYNDEYKILLSLNYYEEVAEQLYAMGYELGKQVFVMWSSSVRMDASEDTIKSIEKDLDAGRTLYEDIKVNSGDNTIYICPYPGTGDVYLVGLYLTEEIKKHGYLLVTSKACAKVAGLFGLESQVISKSNAIHLVHYVRYCGISYDKVRILNDGVDQGNVPRLRGCYGLDFNTLFQRLVFNSAEKKSRHELIVEKADDFFDKYELKKGKTVLIAPYANTVIDINKNFWESLVVNLKKRGYCVCTNVGSPKEKPIEGTIPLSIDYSCIINFLNSSGYFIGLRSGLCDIVTASNAKMVVFYPAGITMVNSKSIEYFGLYNMSLRDRDLLEIEYEANEVNTIMGGILDFCNKTES